MRAFILILFFSATPSLAFSRDQWIAVEPLVEKVLAEDLIKSHNQKLLGVAENFYLVDEMTLPQFSNKIHKQLKRCGGYRILSDSPTTAELNKRSEFVLNSTSLLGHFDYEINQEKNVNSAVKTLSEFYMNSVITKLSSFRTRHYKTPEGIAAMKWIKEEWQRLALNRSDISVEYFQHSNHDQPSVILTFHGSDEALKDELIILGGHADSINTDDFENDHAHAPGADDNAAGIAVLSAIIKSLVQAHYQPQHSVQFIAYAAEEVGIQGSYELAKTYRIENKNVIGVLQFDGLNYSGKSYDMALISDSTHPAQNTFLAQLIDHYLHVPWTWDKCGYGCSDHAAWTYEGFRASYPIEAIKKELNPFFHTTQDIFARSNNSSAHAKKFALLGTAFLMELDQ